MTSVALYKIADTFQIPLKIQGKDVSGEVDVFFNGTQNSLNLPIKVSARKMFSFEQTGVLFHVKGKLWVLVAHNDEHAASSFFVIDAGKCEADGVGIPPDRLMGSKLNLRETIKLFGNAVVKAYARRAQGKWEQFRIN